MSGNGNVAPVPTSEPAVGFADAVCVRPANAASATTASTTRLAARMRFMILIPLSLRFGTSCLPQGRARASLLSTAEAVWFAKVKLS
jgi:hypothetical protein